MNKLVDPLSHVPSYRVGGRKGGTEERSSASLAPYCLSTLCSDLSKEDVGEGLRCKSVCELLGLWRMRMRM